MLNKLQPWEVTHEFGLEGEQSRYHFTLDDFARRERGTGLDVAQYYWQAMRSTGVAGLPLVSEFDDRVVPVNHFDGVVAVVDVTADAPLNFEILRHANLDFWRRNDATGEGWLRDNPIPMVRDAVAREYDFCKSVREPMYTEIIQVLWGFSRHYVRLVLPLGDEKGRVVRLAYCTRRIEPLVPFMASTVGPANQ